MNQIFPYLTIALAICAYTWLLDRRDEREREERTQLLNRIQDPVAVVASTLPPLDIPQGKGYISEEDEQRFWDAQVAAAEKELNG